MVSSLSWVKNATVTCLILVLGIVVGFRYAVIGELPLGIRAAWFQQLLQKSITSQSTNGSPAAQAGLTRSALDQVTGQKAPPKTIQKKVDFDLFWETWAILERDYIEPEKIEANKMLDGALMGMTASLDDPYTMYLPPKENERSGEDLAGSFFGVGMELGYVEENLAVVSPLDGTPAHKAGIQAGDLILHVKDAAKNLDEDTTGWSLTKAVDAIRGQKGTYVDLTLYRKGENAQPFVVSVQRDEIVVKSVELFMVENQGKKVAHLKISRFGERTESEWNEAVKEILANKKQLKGIVLDMRNNPGGFFDTSIELASDFLAKEVVVQQKSRLTTHEYRGNGSGRLKGIPLVVLVNKGSASASEILAGALRDDLGIKLVGEKTFGKGTVQDRRELSNGGGLHVTIARWLLPKGGWIHKEGIPVDVESKDDPETKEVDEALVAAMAQLP